MFSLLVMLYLKDLFVYIPDACLGAVLIATTMTLFNYREMIVMFYVGLMDFAAMMLTFLGMLLLGADKGIMIGVGFSLFVSLHRIAHPNITMNAHLLGSDDDNASDSASSAHSQLSDFEVFKLHESLWFPNSQFFTDYVLHICLDELNRRKNEGLPSGRGVIVDLSMAHTMDESGVLSLIDIHRFLSQRGMVLILVNLDGYVHKFVENCGKILPAFQGDDRIIIVGSLAKLHELVERETTTSNSTSLPALLFNGSADVESQQSRPIEMSVLPVGTIIFFIKCIKCIK